MESRVRTRAICGILALGAVSLLAAVPVRAAVSQTIHVGVDADGAITMTFADGTPIGSATQPGTQIPAGSYQLVVSENIDDQGDQHAFHLRGPGVDVATSSTQGVQSTTTVTFAAASVYSFVDDDVPTRAPTYFSTPGAVASTTGTGTATTTTAVTGGSTPSSSDPVGSEAVAPLRGTLTAAVSAAGAVTLRFHGMVVTSLRAGRYTFVVTDRSGTAGFVVQQTGATLLALTSTTFVGTKHHIVTLRAGHWSFRSPGKLRHVFTVTA